MMCACNSLLIAYGLESRVYRLGKCVHYHRVNVKPLGQVVVDPVYIETELASLSY